MLEKQHQSEAFNLAQYIKNSNKRILYLCNSNKDARFLKNELQIFFNKEEIGFYPEREILPYDRFSTTESIIQERIRLLNSDKIKFKIILSSCLNIFEKLPPSEYFISRKKFKSGDLLSINELKKNLDALNYQRVDKVTSINEYAVRGGVIDFYSGYNSKPIRVDFFDNEIEEIRHFDPSTQHMTNKLSEFKLFNGSEMFLDDYSIKEFKISWRNYFQNHDERNCETFKKISLGKYPEGYEIYNPLLYSKHSILFDYFNDFELVKCKKIDQILNSHIAFVHERYMEESIDIARPILQPNDYIYELSYIKNYLKASSELKNINRNYLKDFPKNLDSQLEFLITKQASGDIKSLLITSSEQLKLDKVNKEFLTKNISLPLEIQKGVFSSINLPSRSFGSDFGEFIHFSLDGYINPENVKNHSSENNKNSLILKFDNPFHDNELVVHIDYGVGIYKGLKPLKTNQSEEEFIQIEYRDKEILYVPIRQAHLVSKFQASQSHNISLDSLSSTKWKNKKEKAQNKAHDHAAELLDIESRRMTSSSDQLICDQDSYRLFDNDFPYVLTNDQKNCINDLLKDISLIKPMNRVICGDVGFGKTEIAMRGAFVAVQAKKQVILLAPSTVLASQHLESFTKRFINFPINIEIFTRHTTIKQRTKIYKNFHENKIDILIGTHAILNSEISLDNLGLLIIDEEHRFGTKQKEIIKSRQSQTHILYMSATPIPRTLNHVYSGLKDFSYLYTPPLERLSIKTFLNSQNQQIIKNAVEREASRGGQVFLVQNDISKMEELRMQIKQLLPNISVGIAHGKLSKKEIAKIMNGFNSNSIDVLICSTIVEMGLDIPNANTIIVIDAHNLGLSQLHQLRGRVGRSVRQAYCYLLIPTMDIKKNQKARLESLIKYSDLGAGYFIAQEDLEVRGAGDFLGVKQSGHVEVIGLSMYLSMLKNAVDDLKGNKKEMILETEINFNDRALISETYLPVANERLKVYRALNDAKSINEISIILDNLKDRCGKPDDDLINLIENSKLRLLAKKIGIKKIYANKQSAQISFNENLSDKVYKKLIARIQDASTKIKLNNASKISFDVSSFKNRRVAITDLLNDLA